MTITKAADIVKTAGGVPLKEKLQRVERLEQAKTFALLAPLLLFIVVTFAAPITILLFRSIDNPEIAQNLPRTITALSRWDGQGLPDEAAFAAFAEDMKEAQKNKTAALIGKRLNYEIPAIRSAVIETGRAVTRMTSGPYKDAILKLDPLWGERSTWATLQRDGARYTSFYLLFALDRRLDADGHLRRVPGKEAIFVDVFLRTFGISLAVTLGTLLLGFPVAYLLASLPVRTSNVLMILVLLPFWTSLLVRTTAWVVLLQDRGVINSVLLRLHLIDKPLELIFSRFGTIVAMTHLQLPFTLLPIYSVMKTISPTYVRAARSLGAGPFLAFWRVYFPQTLSGVAAGCLLTFILSLGYYITPALVGGPADQMVSYYVALYTNQEINWGQASALAFILLGATTALYLVYSRVVGVDQVKLG